MISQRLLHVLEMHNEEIAGRWIKDVHKDLDTISYKKIPKDKLREAAVDLYEQMARWLKNPAEGTAWLEEIYLKRGRERQQEGFHVAEVVHAIALSKQHLWNFMKEEGVFDSATEMYQGLEMLQNVGFFFDRVIYYLVLGFEREASVESWKRP